MSDTNDTEARAELDELRRRLADQPNALALAAQLNERATDLPLDLRTLHLVRAAALAASGAPPIAWRVNLELMDGEVTPDDLEAVLAAVAPIIGTARYLEAVTHIVAD